MQKLERDGSIAVLISPGHGAGWSTWNSEHREVLCMDADIVQAVLDDDRNKAAEIAKQKCGENVYTGGAGNLVVEWVPKGKAFEVDEYDGSESLHVIGDHSYMVA